jgi:proteasome lid subunit RPN8/RPN11
MKKTQATAANGDATLQVTMAAEAQRKIRQHARSSMDAEICGVLIGTMEPGRTVVEETIAGAGARQAGTHVTFTQETWAHIYEVKDAQYPDHRIVGWYHSHPSFGIFLSDHDLFIHRNFFSDANQIAWVVDPHSDEEGCFAWQEGEIAPLRRITVEGAAAERTATREEAVHKREPDKTAWRSALRWGVFAALQVTVLLIGFALGVLVGPGIVIVRGSEKAAPAASPSAVQGMHSSVTASQEEQR